MERVHCREPKTQVKAWWSWKLKVLFISCEPIPHWARWIINVTLSNAASVTIYNMAEYSSLRKPALPHSLNIHMVVQVVIWAEEYLWPLHLSVQFAVHLACVVPKPVSLNKDRLFASPAPTLRSTHNISPHQCQEAQIKSGLNKIYLHPCMQGKTDPCSSALTFLSGRGTPLKDYLSGSGLH